MYASHKLPTSLAPSWQLMSLADDCDLWKLRQFSNCGSFGGISIGKQAKSATLHPAAKTVYIYKYLI